MYHICVVHFTQGLVGLVAQALKALKEGHGFESQHWKNIFTKRILTRISRHIGRFLLKTLSHLPRVRHASSSTNPDSPHVTSSPVSCHVIATSLPRHCHVIKYRIKYYFLRKITKICLTRNIVIFILILHNFLSTIQR